MNDFVWKAINYTRDYWQKHLQITILKLYSVWIFDRSNNYCEKFARNYKNIGSRWMNAMMEDNVWMLDSGEMCGARPLILS